MVKRIIASGLTVLVVTLVTMAGLLAQLPSSAFELDGNAIVDNAPSDDWANTVPPPPGASSEAFQSTFIADGSGNATIFTTGGSKDVNDISQWRWKDQLGGLPDKDNITNAYAAAYIENGDLIIYFGADRFTTEGDAQLGFWFFKNQVQTGPNDTFVGADGQPVSHANGDILVLANMSNGGSVFTAQVYEWMNGALVLKTTEAGAKCGTNTDPNVCFTTNSTTAASPWNYTPKGETGDQDFPALTFFEGAINISHFTQGGTPSCFSSFLAETRSSTSNTATLKDFALGSFNTCKLSAQADCPSVVYDPATNLLNYTFNVTVTNDGFGTLFDLVATATGPVAIPQLTHPSLAVGQSHTFTATFSLTPGVNTPNPPTVSFEVSAAVALGGQLIVHTGTVSATCPPVSFDANLTITKQCSTRLEAAGGRVSVVVDVAGQVCNVPPGAGSPDIPSPIDSVKVNDAPALNGGEIDLGSLAPGECKNYAGSYFPMSLSPGGNLASQQTYEDTVNVTGVRRLPGSGSANKVNTATANCPLCF